MRGSSPASPVEVSSLHEGPVASPRSASSTCCPGWGTRPGPRLLGGQTAAGGQRLNALPAPLAGARTVGQSTPALRSGTLTWPFGSALAFTNEDTYQAGFQVAKGVGVNDKAKALNSCARNTCVAHANTARADSGDPTHSLVRPRQLPQRLVAQGRGFARASVTHALPFRGAENSIFVIMKNIDPE